MLAPRLEKIRQRLSDETLLSLRGIPEDFTADDVFGVLASTDPTPGHKYIGWLSQRISSFKYEDVSTGRDSTVGTTLADFERLKKTLPETERSLMKHKSIADLWRAIKPALEAEESVGETVGSREAKRRSAMKANMESVVNSSADGLKSISLLTREAAKFWGKQSRWCTAAEKANLFSEYANTGPLIVFITPDKKKYQFHADLEKLGAVYDWDTPSDMYTSCAFLNDADEPLTQEDYKSLIPHREAILAAIRNTPVSNLELPRTWVNGKTPEEAIVDGFLEMAKETPRLVKDETQQLLKKKSAPHPGPLRLTPQGMSQDVYSEYEKAFKGISSAISIVSVDISHSMSPNVAVKEERAGVVIPRDKLSDAIQILKEIEMSGNDSADIILLPESGYDSLEFHGALCKSILSDARNLKTEWSRECFRYSLQKHPEIFAQLVIDNIASLEEKGRPRYSEAYTPFLMRQQSAINNFFGTFTISEDKIGELTDAIREHVKNEDISHEGHTYACDAIAMLTNRAISTSLKPLDISTIGAAPHQYGVEDKDFPELLQGYVIHCASLVAKNIFSQDQAIALLEPTNNNISQEQMIKSAVSKSSLMRLRADTLRYADRSPGKEFYDEIFKRHPRLSPDMAFRMAPAKDVTRFKKNDLTEDMCAKLDKIEFFDKTLPVWLSEAAPDIVSRLSQAVMSSAIPQMTPEIQDAIQSNNTSIVTEASKEQKMEIIKTIFTNPATGHSVMKQLQDSYMHKLRLAKSLTNGLEKNIHMESPENKSAPSM